MIKKLQAEKPALELKIAEDNCEEEIKLRVEAERRATELALRKRAEELKLECEYEGALSKEDFGSDNENIIDEELRKLPLDSVNDRVFRLGVDSAPNAQITEDGEQIASKLHLTNPKELTRQD